MAVRKTGSHERTTFGGETVAAFLPAPLPPVEPPLDLGGPVGERLRAAEHALRRLDLAAQMVPSIDWFLYAFVRKEAVLSSQIEGTQATLVDLLTFEAEEATSASVDVEEVCNYVDALTFARSQLADPKGLPLSMRLLSGTHAKLMRGVRGAEKSPGEIRQSQNWIGGSRPGNAAYVPPPPHALKDLLSAFEKYIHAEHDLPPLIRAGLLHVQFETIHPYLDGNGRLGRLLITLLLEHWGLLSKPVLYLSLFFKQHRAEYFRRLNEVRVSGDWEAWLDFFLDGVATISESTVTAARELFELTVADRARILAVDTTTIWAIRLFESLPKQPILSVSTAMRLLNTSNPTARRAIEGLLMAGILVETTGRKRDRWFAYQAYLERLRVGTDLEPARTPAS